PSPLSPPPGCHFHTRCPVAVDRCRTDVPELRELGEPPATSRRVACHLAKSSPSA
ncbi:peptide ABC transporter ATP-binding protein, partial [Streptomyces purpurogeneiscleroticus]|nr:peptide ABC transporter ATP-binding protein [Streptomyces purpurogeneiscleroticus]